MSQSAQIILGAPNPFTTNPSMTYFKTNYEFQDSPLGESFEIPFDNQQVRFGTTGQCTIPTYGDLFTKAFLRVTLPAIYPPQIGTYVYPNTSTSFSGALLVQKNLTYITADGANLTANTDGSHFFSVGSNVILSGTAYSIFNLDGVYTISSIPTANSFACSSGLAGISYSGKVSAVGIQPTPVVGYYSTQNLNLWAETPVNLAYNSIGGQITVPNASLVPGQTITIVSSSSGGTPAPGSTEVVLTSSGNTFTIVGTLFGPLFVAFNISVVSTPFFMTSPDYGSTWVKHALPYSQTWNSVIFGSGKFVAVSNGPVYVMTSGDGIYWTAQTVPSGQWTAVTYGNNQFVSVSQTGAIITSPDGITWSAPVSVTASDWQSITYGSGSNIVAVSSTTPYFMLSTDDGASWSYPSVTPSTYFSVAYGGGYFVAVSTTSPYIMVWNGSSASYPSVPAGSWASVAYGNGYFTAVSTTGPPYVMTSSDGAGATWVANNTVPGSSGQWYAVAYGNGYFVAV